VTISALRRGLEETLKLVDEVIEEIDHELQENDGRRRQLLNNRDTWCRHREILKLEAASSNGDHG